MSKYIVTVAPAIEPVELAEAKAQCRVDHGIEDDLIKAYISVSRVLVENWLGRALITQTRKFLTDEVECEYELPGAPLQALTSFTLYDESDAATTMSTSAWRVDALEGELYQKPSTQWPSVLMRQVNPIEIVYTCGYGNTADAVPYPIRLAILLLVGHYYTNRQAVDMVRTQGWPQQLEFGVNALLEPYRLISF